MKTDDEIANEARLRYPYGESDNESRINKLSSKRRRFIEGAKWMRDSIFNERNSKVSFLIESEFATKNNFNQQTK